MDRQQMKEQLSALYRLTYHNRIFRTWTKSVQIIKHGKGYAIVFMVDGIYFDKALAEQVAEEFWQPFVDEVTNQVHGQGDA